MKLYSKWGNETLQEVIRRHQKTLNSIWSIYSKIKLDEEKNQDALNLYIHAYEYIEYIHNTFRIFTVYAERITSRKNVSEIGHIKNFVIEIGHSLEARKEKVSWINPLSMPDDLFVEGKNSPTARLIAEKSTKFLQGMIVYHPKMKKIGKVVIYARSNDSRDVPRLSVVGLDPKEDQSCWDEKSLLLLPKEEIEEMLKSGKVTWQRRVSDEKLSTRKVIKAERNGTQSILISRDEDGLGLRINGIPVDEEMIEITI